MQDKLLARLLMSFLAGLLIAVAAMEAASNHHGQSNSAIEPQEVTFSLTRQPENLKQYNLVISDDDEHTISGSFSVDQLQILRAIMVEAEKFALGEEAAGTKEPITTRFMDAHESAFIVDVEKLGNQSRLFFTIKTEIGRMTLNAGKINRSTKREEGFYFNLLERLESILPKTGKPSK